METAICESDDSRLEGHHFLVTIEAHTRKLNQTVRSSVSSRPFCSRLPYIFANGRLATSCWTDCAVWRASVCCCIILAWLRLATTPSWCFSSSADIASRHRPSRACGEKSRLRAIWHVGFTESTHRISSPLPFLPSLDCFDRR